jgi:hypothetical protein
LAAEQLPWLAMLFVSLFGGAGLVGMVLRCGVSASGAPPVER